MLTAPPDHAGLAHAVIMRNTSRLVGGRGALRPVLCAGAHGAVILPAARGGQPGRGFVLAAARRKRSCGSDPLLASADRRRTRAAARPDCRAPDPPERRLGRVADARIVGPGKTAWLGARSAGGRRALLRALWFFHFAEGHHAAAHEPRACA